MGNPIMGEDETNGEPQDSYEEDEEINGELADALIRNINDHSCVLWKKQWAACGKSWRQQGFISIHEKQKFQPAWLVSFITRVDKPKKGSSCVVVDGLGDAPPVY